MTLFRKLYYRIGDPVFYQKKCRELCRKFKRVKFDPKHRSLDTMVIPQRVVAVIAHPDDEVFCSGLIIELVARGCEVTILCLTRGEGGPTGGGTREDLGKVREAEMKASAAVLGVQKVEFLNHIDPTARGLRVYAPDVSVSDLSAQLDEYFQDAEWVLSHGSSGEYWHPAHLLVYRAVETWFRKNKGAKQRWFTYMANGDRQSLPRFVNWDDPTFLTLDVSGSSEQRRKALYSHESQMELFRQFAKGTNQDFVDNNPVEFYSKKH